jgi:hypothetical protein
MTREETPSSKGQASSSGASETREEIEVIRAAGNED